MNPRLLQEELECARYGRTKTEAMGELKTLDETIFGLCGCGDIEVAYDVIAEDIGLLTLLDDIAKKRISTGNPCASFGNTPYHKQERVKELLLSSKKFPNEIYFPL